MTTATAEAPASSSAAELIEHEYNEHGVFETPDVVTVPMPKGLTCEIRLAHKNAEWFMGHTFHTKTGTSGSPCKVDVAGHDSRRAALQAGLVAACKFFEGAKEKKAVKALEEFHASLGDATLVEKAQMGVGDFAAEPTAADLATPMPRGRFAELPVAAITPNPENHRKFHDAMKAKELRDSIVQMGGLLQPIAVRLLTAEELGELPVAGEGAEAQCYEIILGERRWRAHRDLGRETIEAKVYEGVSRKQAKAAALIENLQREDVNPIEAAEGYKDLMDAEGLTQEACADRLGRSRSEIAKAVGVLSLPAEVVDLIRQEKLTIAHGMALRKYATRPNVLKIIAEQAVLHVTSAGQLEEWNKRDYVPFQNELIEAGILACIQRHELPGGYSTDWPEAWAKDADYFGTDTYSRLCWEPAKAREYLEEWKAQVAEEKRLADEVLAASRKKTGIKSLADLERGKFIELDGAEQSEMAALIPESKVVPVKQNAEKNADTVTVCLVPKFIKQVQISLRQAKEADRMTKLPQALAAARAKVKKWKKLGATELAIVMAVMMASSDEEGFLSPAAAKSQGVTIPVALKLEDYEGSNARLPDDLSKAIKALAADPVAYARVLVDDYLVGCFCDTWCWDRQTDPAIPRFDNISDGERAVLMAILDEPLGLLEDTKAGRRKLAEQVRALPWYAAAYEQASKAGQDMGEIDEAAQAAAEGEEGDDNE